MSNGSQRQFGFKRLTAVLVMVIVVLAVFALSVNGLFVSSVGSSNESATQVTPTQPPATATPTETATPTPNHTQIPISVDFTCRYAGSPDAFAVTVAVDLNDGMNQDEAVTVATAIIDHELGNAVHKVKSAETSGSSEWQVDFNWEFPMTDQNGTAIGPILGHVFDVTINAQNRTASYTRCM